MNIITLDGYSGSGKSTQLGLLATKLNYDIASYEQLFVAFRAMAEALPRTKGFGSIDFIASMYAFHLMPNPQNCIFDHFWEALSAVYHRNRTNFQSAVRFFRHGLSLSRCGEPNLSILIDLPFDVAVERQLKRDHGVDANVSDSADHRNDFVEGQSQFWAALEGYVPYFHRVNGNQSVNDVTEDILSLIHREQERRHL